MELRVRCGQIGMVIDEADGMDREVTAVHAADRMKNLYDHSGQCCHKDFYIEFPDREVIHLRTYRHGWITDHQEILFPGQFYKTI